MLRLNEVIMGCLFFAEDVSWRGFVHQRIHVPARRPRALEGSVIPQDYSQPQGCKKKKKKIQLEGI